MALRQVSKKAIWNMLVGALCWAALLAAALVLVWIWILAPESPHTAYAVGYWLIGGFVLAAVLLSPVIRWRRYRYQIDENRIIMQEGIWFLRTEFAPIERVHQIAVLRGPIDRMTGLAKVVATTAGGEIVIRFLELQTAEELAAGLERQIKQIVHRQGASE